MTPPTCAVLLLCFAGPAPSPALAQDTPGKSATVVPSRRKPSAAVIAAARRRFTRANRLYRNGTYKEALLAYQAALDLYVRPGILYNMAQTYEKLRDPANAARYYQKYLQMRPKAVDRKKVVERIGRLRKEARVDVSITSYPAGAAVYVGDKGSGVRGRTPARLSLPLGPQSIIVELEGFVPEFRSIEVKLEQRNFIDAQLVRRSSIRVSADIPGARAFIDDKGPVREYRVPHVFEVQPGSYAVHVELEGFHPVQRTVDVQAGEQVSFLVNLKELPKYGRLRVEGVPGARVAVDDRDLDMLPMPARQVAAGSRRVMVRRDGYRSWEGKITVAENKLTVARVSLSPLRSTGIKTVIYGTGALGVAAVITGAVFGVLALRSEREFNSNTNASVGTFNTGKSQALTADIFFATAGAAALTAVVTWLATQRGPSTADQSVSEAATTAKAASP